MSKINLCVGKECEYFEVFTLSTGDKVGVCKKSGMTTDRLEKCGFEKEEQNEKV